MSNQVKGFGYDNAQYQSHDFNSVVAVANANTNLVLSCVNQPVQAYSGQATAVSGAGNSNVAFFHVTAANGTVALLGFANCNVGNTATVYFSPGNTGGITLAAGDVLYANVTSAGVVAVTGEVSLNTSANVTA